MGSILGRVRGGGGHGGEVVLEEFVDEAVAIADPLEEGDFGTVVEEAGVVQEGEGFTIRAERHRHQMGQES